MNSSPRTLGRWVPLFANHCGGRCPFQMGQGSEFARNHQVGDSDHVQETLLKASYF